MKSEKPFSFFILLLILYIIGARAEAEPINIKSSMPLYQAYICSEQADVKEVINLELKDIIPYYMYSSENNLPTGKSDFYLVYRSYDYKTWLVVWVTDKHLHIFSNEIGD